jgi:hypothetical protein
MKSNTVLNGTPSREDIIAFGGIPDVSSTDLRSSGRIRAQPNADATQMERAMVLAAARDSPGTIKTPCLSFCDIPDSVVAERVSKLGVSLG